MKLYEELILSKKLKRRIQELCGFNDLEREERINRAHEILNSAELKQAICHKILGATFKDVERAMEGIIKERQLTSFQEEELELRELYPEKYSDFDAEMEFKFNKQAADVQKGSAPRHYTREEVADLLKASGATYEAPKQSEWPQYPFMAREVVEQLVRDHFEYKVKEESLKKEREKWDSAKTTELEQKIAAQTKRTTSTNPSKKSDSTKSK